MKEILT